MNLQKYVRWSIRELAWTLLGSKKKLGGRLEVVSEPIELNLLAQMSAYVLHVLHTIMRREELLQWSLYAAHSTLLSTWGIRAASEKKSCLPFHVGSGRTSSAWRFVSSARMATKKAKPVATKPPSGKPEAEPGSACVKLYGCHHAAESWFEQTAEAVVQWKTIPRKPLVTAAPDAAAGSYSNSCRSLAGKCISKGSSGFVDRFGGGRWRGSNACHDVGSMVAREGDQGV